MTLNQSLFSFYILTFTGGIEKEHGNEIEYKCHETEKKSCEIGPLVTILHFMERF